MAGRRSSPSSRRTRSCSGTSSATSSTATASSSGSRTSGPRSWPRAQATPRFVLNADDPLVADLGRDREGSPRERVTYFGVEDRSQALAELEHAFDAKHCRRCGSLYTYAAAYLGHLGDYACPQLRQPAARAPVAAARRRAARMSGSASRSRLPRGELELALPLPASTTSTTRSRGDRCCLELGIAPETITARARVLRRRFRPRRAHRFGGRELAILLIKNPAGANEVFGRCAAAERRASSTSGSR